MNKAIKIILIFAGVAVLLFLAVKLENYLMTGGYIKQNNSSVYQKLSQEIEREWTDAGKWDKNLFERQIADMDDRYQGGILKKADRNSLIQKIGETAWRTIDSVFNYQMSSPTSDKRVVDANKKGLDVMLGFKDKFEKKQVFKESEHIKLSQAMYDEYKTAMEFAEKIFAAPVSLDAQFKWTPFNDYKASWDKKKKKIEEGRYFNSHFKNINKVKNTWNNYSSTMAASQRKFNERLSDVLPSRMSIALLNITIESDKCVSAGNDAVLRRSHYQRDYPSSSVLPEAIQSALTSAKNDLQGIYDQADTFCKDADEAIKCFGNQVGTSGSAYTKLTDLKNQASRVRVETKRLIEKI